MPAPVAPTRATVSPGSAVKVEIGDRGALAVVGERNVLEFHQAVQAAGIQRVGAVAHRRLGVEHLEEFLDPRRVHHHAVGELHDVFEPADQQRGDSS